MGKAYKIGEQLLTLSTIRELMATNQKVGLTVKAKQKIKSCRNYLDKRMKVSDTPIYGVNTGFGSLYNHKIPSKDLEQLQANLVLSHACGIGEEVPHNVVKIMLLLKAQSLSYGHSGVQLKTVERLLSMYNNNVLPVVYKQGSLGASGDLSPLAHLSLPLLGEGELYLDGKRTRAKTALRKMSWDVIKLQSKEGLALLNGTQIMTAYGAWALLKSQILSYIADLIGSISLEAYDGRDE